MSIMELAAMSVTAQPSGERRRLTFEQANQQLTRGGELIEGD
jgi:hypothetical protein